MLIQASAENTALVEPNGQESTGTSSIDQRLPDFIIAGAPRCGTTWLYHMLARHPFIKLARPVVPEPKFFLVDDLYNRGLTYYSSTWFASFSRDCIVGEKSTNYLESATAAFRIRKDLPDVKLVFILRNPIDRAYSNYLWSCKNGIEKDSFLVALRREQEREQSLPPHLRYARPHAYFSRGLYFDLLQPYWNSFPRERILCLRFEDISQDPRRLTGRLHQFLGVDQHPEDGLDLGVVNESDAAAPPMSPEIRTMLRERYREANLRLAELLGQDFWPEERM